jgi:hypothetical protein
MMNVVRDFSIKKFQRPGIVFWKGKRKGTGCWSLKRILRVRIIRVIGVKGQRSLGILVFVSIQRPVFSMQEPNILIDLPVRAPKNNFQFVRVVLVVEQWKIM